MYALHFAGCKSEVLFTHLHILIKNLPNTMQQTKTESYRSEQKVGLPSSNAPFALGPR